MALNLLEPGAKAVLDHLHSPANAQNGQVPPLGQIEQRGLGFVALRSVAAIGREIVSAGKDDTVESARRSVNAASTELGIGMGINPQPRRNFTQT